MIEGLLSRSLLLCLITFISAGCAGLSNQPRPLFDGHIAFDPVAPRQIIEVVPSPRGEFKAILRAWTYEAGTYRRIFGPWPVVIGRNGFAPLDGKREGDGRTPTGIFNAGTAFGKEKQLHTGLLYRQTTDEDVWIDDTASAQYNCWVKIPIQAASFEKMLRPDGLYDIGAVIEYNTKPVLPGYGSAIFIHIWRDHGQKPTAGCVALSQRRLRCLLKWLRADAKPIFILGQPYL